MKISTILLTGSLVANAVTVGLLVFKSPSADLPSSPSSPATVAAAPDTAASEAAQIAKAWEKIQGGDIDALAERLRAAGFPPSIVKAIVATQLYEQLNTRRRALLAQVEATPYWLSQDGSAADPKVMAELRQISREQTALMKDLLGLDGDRAHEKTVALQKRQFGDLSPDKLDQMQSIVRDYSELRQQIQQAANGALLPEDREMLAILEREQRADLAKLLSPDELENYDLRSSNTASKLRSLLGIFKPTEEEFREIFRATRAAEDRYGSLSQATPDVVRQIQQEAVDSLRGSLAPDRVADLMQAVDPRYQQINRLVARLDLPSSTSVDVVAVQQDIQKRAGTIRTDKSLSSVQRNEQLTALQQEAAVKIGAALGGARGFNAYTTYFGGQWIQNLVPRPAATPANPKKS